MVTVAELLPPFEALKVVRSIDQPELRARALERLAERLPREEKLNSLREALVATSAIRTKVDLKIRLLGVEEWSSNLALIMDARYERVEALIDVALESPLSQTLEIARSIEDAESRAQALARIAQKLPAEKRPAVLDESLMAARGIPDSVSRTWALAKIAARLPPEQRLFIRDEAISASGDIDETFRDWALVRVAALLPPSEAIDVVRYIQYAVPEGAALAEISSRLPPDEALEVARAIANIDPENLPLWNSRAPALAEVIRRLPVEQALNVVGEIEDIKWRARALAEVASRLPSEQQPVLFRQALDLARDEESEWSRGQALAEVADRLPPDEALVIARGIDDANWRRSALVGVADRLAEAPISNLSIKSWTEAVHVLALRRRADCVGDFAAMLAIVEALGDEAALRGVGRSIASIRAWWP